MSNHTKHKRRNVDLLDEPPPRDFDSEAAILGVALMYPARFAEITKALTAEDFTDEAHRTIYGAMLRLHALGRPIDPTLVVSELRDFGEYDRDKGITAATICNLYRLFPLQSNLQWYVGRMLEMSRRRRGLERGIKLVQAAHNPSTLPMTPRRRRFDAV